MKAIAKVKAKITFPTGTWLVEYTRDGKEWLVWSAYPANQKPRAAAHVTRARKLYASEPWEWRMRGAP